jgi:cardiolipin synthase
VKDVERATGAEATGPEQKATDAPVSYTVCELGEKGLYAKGRRRRMLGDAVRFGYARARAIPSRRRSFLLWTFFAFAYAAGFLALVRPYLCAGAFVSAVAAEVAWVAFMVWFSYIHLDMVRREDGTPWKSFLLPNGMTLTRLVMVPLVGFAAAHSAALRADGDWILWPLVAVVVSDILDGQIARFGKLKSDWGRMADPASDVYLACWFAAGLWSAGLLPWWLASVIIFRYAGTLVGVFTVWGLGLSIKVRPTWPGRAANLAVDVYLPFLLAGALRFPSWLGSLWHVWLFRVVAAVVVFNIVYYFWRLFVWLARRRHDPNAEPP